MKRTIAVLLFLGLILTVLPGCAAVSVRGQTDQEIRDLASTAPVALVMLDANQVDEGAAVAQIQFNALRFNAWADKATINFFSYVFGTKEILATVGQYKHLQDNAAFSVDDLRQATTRPARAVPRLKDQYKRVLILKAVIDGVNPPK
jgi:hypothetical protein